MSDKINPSQILAFIAESNRIEGIPETSQDDIDAHLILLERPMITLPALKRFVKEISGAAMRESPGMNVYVGNHRPVAGGPHVPRRLEEILRLLTPKSSPHAIHLAYETLHPFMDGNGRSGRAIWAWHRRLKARDPFQLGFLHSFYYETLEHSHTLESTVSGNTIWNTM